MVDEFQDTNRLQCELIDLVAHPDRTEVFTVGDEFQSIYGFRHADVEVFRERRAQAPTLLALTRNYRSRPEVLAAVNHLFGDAFGDDYQPLAASAEFADPGVRAPGRAARHGQDELRRHEGALACRRGAPNCRPRARARRIGRSRARRDRRALRSRHGRRAVRGGAPPRRASDLSRDGARLLRPAAGRRPARLPAAAPQPLRRRRARHRARVAVRRRLERHARPSAPQRPAPSAVHGARAGASRAARPRATRACCARSSSATSDWFAPRRGSGSRRSASASSSEHDYDLAVLARWDGTRRFANLRKLGRLARDYESLRGADIEGFVRFVRDQDALGAKELEAVAEEEGGDAVRLLTIHAAKGLEFKVVIVADAGRDVGGPRGPDEIVALSDGRFGFRMVHPTLGDRRGVFGWDEVKEAARRPGARRAAAPLLRRDDAGDRPSDRLGSDRSRSERRIARRRSAGCSSASMPTSAVPEAADDAGRARSRRRAVRPLRRPPSACTTAVEVAAEVAAAESMTTTSCSSPCSTSCRPAARGSASSSPSSHAIAPPPVHDVRRLSYSALALFERCSYRFYAERVLGLPPPRARRGAASNGAGSPRPRSATRFIACSSSSRSTRRSRRRGELDATVRAWYPDVTEDELERVAGLVDAYCASPLARGSRAFAALGPERPFTFEHDGVLLRGRLDVLWQEGERALIVDYKSNALEGREPAEIVEAEYGLQRLVYALVCLRAGIDRGRDRVPVPRAARRRRVDVVHARRHPRAGGGALRRDRPHPRGRLPADAERVRVLGLPGARPRLRRAAPRARAVASRRARRGDQRHPRRTFRRSKPFSRTSSAKESTRSSSSGTPSRAMAGRGVRSRRRGADASIVRGNADRAVARAR